MTNDIRSIHSIEFEGFYYVVTNEGVFGKGCSRCGGTGHYSFNGVDSICYKCSNIWEFRLGDIFDTEAAAQKWCHERAVRRAQAERKREAKRMVEVNALADKVAALPEDVRNFLTAVKLEQYSSEENYYEGKQDADYEKDAFIRSMAEQIQFVTNARRPFTDKMVEAVRKVIARRSERATEAASHPAPTGRVAVTGEIVSAKATEGDYGTSYKILVKDDAGFKVWVSLPSAQREQQWDTFFEAVEAAGYSTRDFGPDCWFLGTNDNDDRFAGVKGRRITFTATLEPSRDDIAFAFGSRPTKGAWL